MLSREIQCLIQERSIKGLTEKEPAVLVTAIMAQADTIRRLEQDLQTARTQVKRTRQGRR